MMTIQELVRSKWAMSCEETAPAVDLSKHAIVHTRLCSLRVRLVDVDILPGRCQLSPHCGRFQAALGAQQATENAFWLQSVQSTG